MNITIPDLALVLLIGPSGSGKSTFARAHFKPTEVISSDACRAMVSDDENDPAATPDAFDLLNFIAAKRLAAGRLTVIDATNVQAESRKPFLALAREYHVPLVAITLDMPENVCVQRDRSRTDRHVGSEVIRKHRAQLRRSLGALKREGIRHSFVLRSPEEAEAVTVLRQPLWPDRRGETGPFDIIGDLHGCCGELETLLGNLGYRWSELPANPDGAPRRYLRRYHHPEGRRAIFLGDIVDRGPRILDSYELVRNMAEAGDAIVVPGNHDVKLARKLRGEMVMVRHGLESTLAELEALPSEYRQAYAGEMERFLDRLISHYVLDEGRLVVAHAGMKANMQGRASARVREFALFGETTGETDEFGLPVRYNWAAEYRGAARVVYGHTPVPKPEWLNRTINIDTGCVFGGALTALRYPEMELVSVPAERMHAEPVRPIGHRSDAGSLTAQQLHDDVLDLGDILGKRLIDTRLLPAIAVREENGRAALEVMSRFAVDPKWLIYLPPTMSPTATSQLPDLLEHPAEAFAYYRREGIARVICEEKHMGSRAVVVLCRNPEAAQRRFGTAGTERGLCYTRTGRRFFGNIGVEHELLGRLDTALEGAGIWKELDTDWIALDCELMPWSAKAQELLQTQYAAVGAAAERGFALALEALRQAESNGAPVASLLERFTDRAAMLERYTDAYRRYCWSVRSADDLKLAPFHILATEGGAHTGRDHQWHMETIARFAAGAPSLHATPYRIIDLNDPVSEADGIRWWEELTGRGGEGMVVKPFDYIAAGNRGIVQPAIKCRGREYLRIIYGPEYTAPGQMELLRQRNLGLKRSLAMREFALGVEALERFVAGEPLRRVHECVFGILAMESEPVDPRL